MQGFSLDMIKLSSAQLVLSQKSQLFVWWTLFQKMSWEFFLHRPMERNDILPPPLMARHTWGSWFKQTWIFTTQGCFLASLGFTDRVVFEKKKLYNFLNIFLCTPPPYCGPIQPWIMWFKQNEIFTTWGCFHTSRSLSVLIFLEDLFENIYKFSLVFNYLHERGCGPTF